MGEIKHICPWAGCNNLIPIRERYCETHQAAANRRRRSNKWRPPSSQRGYDSTWRRIRAQVLLERPYCEARLKCKGARATEVHHRISLRFGGTHDRSNLVAVCRSCHSTITSKSPRG